ncbi:hypothetical protein LSH36_424g02041 [Paralvinella palmiformis]|uniref:Uncharacterized protein n=1 Tax=Paralvinella palmiformis TaxID=53620 RepID=A0AAD9JBM7_9ANNE|nr:hypothetical protein LSH36_424g02041 [Paralvinella palmiformis]
MNIVTSKSRILGLSWRQLGQAKDENDDNIPFKSPQKPSDDGEKKTSIRKGPLRRSLRRMQSVRDAFGSLRQKLKTSTRRRKRLTNASPYTPKHRSNMTSTPSSVQRRSTRLAQQQEDKMYSPFTIDTPSKTPSKIRMGIHEPKRFNFSSPGQIVRDVNSLTEGIRALTDMSEKLNAATGRTGIRTTPNVSRTSRKPIFV